MKKYKDETDKADKTDETIDSLFLRTIDVLLSRVNIKDVEISEYKNNCMVLKNKIVELTRREKRQKEMFNAIVGCMFILSLFEAAIIAYLLV